MGGTGDFRADQLNSANGADLVSDRPNRLGAGAVPCIHGGLFTQRHIGNGCRDAGGPGEPENGHDRGGLVYCRSQSGIGACFRRRRTSHLAGARRACCAEHGNCFPYACHQRGNAPDRACRGADKVFRLHPVAANCRLHRWDCHRRDFVPDLHHQPDGGAGCVRRIGGQPCGGADPYSKPQSGTGGSREALSVQRDA